MIRYTTPILPLEVEGIDLTQRQDVYATLLQEDTAKLTKSGSDLTIEYNSEANLSTVSFVLTQEESAGFDLDGPVLVQVNFINELNLRDATTIARIPVMRNLLDEVIQYGDQA